MLTAVEIDVRLLPKYIIAYRPGLWMYPLYGSETIMFSDVECIFDGIAKKNVNIIKSMRNGIEEMIPAYSVDECDATPNSFFYDNDFNGEKMIFFNIAENGVGHKHWLNKSLEIGVIDGFLMQEDVTREEGCYYKDSLYATRVSKIPTITMKRDWLFYGKLQFNDGSVELINCDGALDDRDDIGSFIRIYAFNPGDEMEDWTLIYTGAISRTKTSEDSYTINFTDKREYVNRQIIAGKINRITCPTVYNPATEVKEDTEFVVPVAYGEVENFPAIPIKEYLNSSGTNVVRFKFCAGAGDDIGGSIERGIVHYPYSLNKVWMNSSDDEEEIILTPTAININEGWFEISADQAKSGDTDYTYETILCNYFGWHRISSADRFKNGLPHLNGAEIALDILIMFGFVQYNSANIDLQKYEEEKEKVETDGRILSVLISDDKKTLDVISDVCYSCDCLFPVLSDGRFAIRFDTKEAAPVAEITKYENFTDLTASVDRSDVVTSLILTYGQAGDSENKIEYKDKSLETVLSERWKTFKEYSKETLLADAESVAKKAAAIYDRAKSPRTESEWQVKISKEIAALDIVDAIIAPSNRSGGRAVYDIISNKKDTSGGLITVTGSKRYDIESDPNYTQGVLLGTHLYGGELCAVTNYEVE